MARRRSPSLLRGLPGDAESGADPCPGVAERAQALDRLGYGGVDLLGQAEHDGQGLNVAVADAAGVGARMRRTKALYSSFSTCRRGRFGVNPPLTASGLGSWHAGDVLATWLASCRGVVLGGC
jgi:hypothetical protein